jgi:GR25 family glycosyltransferase involved in LPS biosynthesis
MERFKTNAREVITNTLGKSKSDNIAIFLQSDDNRILLRELPKGSLACYKPHISLLDLILLLNFLTVLCEIK